MLPRGSKTYLKNIIRHTDAHNKVIEEDEMWRDHKKNRNHRNRGGAGGGRSRSPPRVWSNRSRSGIRSRVDEVPHTYMDRVPSPVSDKKIIAAATAGGGDKWGHSGFAELYPEDCPESEKQIPPPEKPERMRRREQQQPRASNFAFGVPNTRNRGASPRTHRPRHLQQPWNNRIQDAFKEVKLSDREKKEAHEDDKRVKSKIVMKTTNEEKTKKSTVASVADTSRERGERKDRNYRRQNRDKSSESERRPEGKDAAKLTRDGKRSRSAEHRGDKHPLRENDRNRGRSSDRKKSTDEKHISKSTSSSNSEKARERRKSGTAGESRPRTRSESNHHQTSSPERNSRKRSRSAEKRKSSTIDADPMKNGTGHHGNRRRSDSNRGDRRLSDGKHSDRHHGDDSSSSAKISRSLSKEKKTSHRSKSPADKKIGSPRSPSKSPPRLPVVQIIEAKSPLSSPPPSSPKAAEKSSNSKRSRSRSPKHSKKHSSKHSKRESAQKSEKTDSHSTLKRPRSGSLSEGEIIDTDEETVVPPNLAEIPMPSKTQSPGLPTEPVVLATENVEKFVETVAQPKKEDSPPPLPVEEKSATESVAAAKMEINFTGFKISGKTKKLKFERKYATESEDEEMDVTEKKPKLPTLPTKVETSEELTMRETANEKENLPDVVPETTKSSRKQHENSAKDKTTKFDASSASSSSQTRIAKKSESKHAEKSSSSKTTREKSDGKSTSSKRPREEKKLVEKTEEKRKPRKRKPSSSSSDSDSSNSSSSGSSSSGSSSAEDEKEAKKPSAKSGVDSAAKKSTKTAAKKKRRRSSSSSSSSSSRSPSPKSSRKNIRKR